MLVIGASAPGPPLGSFGPSQLSGRNSCQDSVHVSVSEAARTPRPDDVMNCCNFAHRFWDTLMHLDICTTCGEQSEAHPER